MTMPWDGIIDVCTLGACLAVATFLRAKIAFLGKFMVPNNIVAGFLCFIFGSEALGVINLSPDFLGSIVYHLLAITFVSMALRKPETRQKVGAVSTGFILAIGIGLQAFAGLSITLIYMLTIDADLFFAFGYFLMLGFSQGPGQAFSLGKTWEPLGFESAGAMGLTFAAVGYLWACIIGVILVHRALKKRSDSDNPIRLSPEDRTGLIDDLSKRPEAGKQTTSALAIDSLSFHLCAVCVIYLATYLLLNGAQKLIESFAQGDMVTQIVNTLWGIHFVFATLIALFVRKILDRTGNAELLDNGTLTRICGGSLDFMVTAAIAAISLRVLFLRPGLILATTTIGGLITIAYIYHCLNHAGLSYRLERMASIFGTMTGTLTTGLTLGRITDPQLKSPAPQALVFGAAFTLPLSIPIIFSSLIVTYGRTQPQPMIYYVGTIALTGIYTAAIYLVWRYFIAGKK